MKKSVIILIFSFTSSILSYGQNSALDRFYQDKILSSINLGKDLLKKNEKESAIEFFTEAIGIAEKRKHDYYAGFLVLNNDILEPTIDWFYSLDSLDTAKHLVGLYERFYDGTEKALKEIGDISESDYYGYMMFCYDHKDYESSIAYGEKYVSTAREQGIFDDDYLEWHKSLVWSQLSGQKYEDAFLSSVEIYNESKKLGHSDIESLQMLRSVRAFAMGHAGLYWLTNDISMQKIINDSWRNFLIPLYEQKGNEYMDHVLMQLDEKSSMREEIRGDATSSVLLAAELTNCCLIYKISGYDAAKTALFNFKELTKKNGYEYLWAPACVSFFEYLQSMQQHSAVYSFCKLIEPDFINKDAIDLDDYLTFYAYYFGACDRVNDIRKVLDILYTRFEDESIKDSPIYWEIARLKGSFYTNYRREGNYEEAIKNYQEDLKICVESDLGDQVYAPLFYLGRIYHSLKNYQKSRDYFIQCAEMKKKSEDSYNRSAPFSYLFDIERIGGNNKKAREYLTTMWGLQLQEYLSFKDYLTVYEQTAYWAKQGAIDYVGGLIAESSPSYNDIYYDMLLTSKGFMQKAETKEYFNVITSGDDRLNSLYNSIHSDAEVSSSLVDEYMSLYRSYKFSSEVQTPSWKEVQEALGKNDVAIEFFKYQVDDMYQNPQYGALVLKHGWKIPHFVHLCSEKDLKQAMKAGPKMYQLSNLLHNLIWEPLQKEVKGARDIYFSPHELIHTINLSAIEDTKGKPLLESYSFHQLSSTYNICERKADKFNTSFVYGGLIYDADDATMIAEHRRYSNNYQSIAWDLDSTVTRAGWAYLPNTKLEIQNVVTQMKAANVTVSEFSGTSGTEESFKSLSGKHPGHIHLATHGFYLSFAPADSTAISESPERRLSSSISALTRSGLILSNGGRAWKGESIPRGIEDGILQADEIAGMDLSGTSLLVLSACQTALGDISSDGVYGLQRAFKIAGVETIIMSLWEVDDKATSLFMSYYYQSLVKGRNKHDAFIDAQKGLIKDYDNPYYWAAFIMLD